VKSNTNPPRPHSPQPGPQTLTTHLHLTEISTSGGFFTASFKGADFSFLGLLTFLGDGSYRLD